MNFYVTCLDYSCICVQVTMVSVEKEEVTWRSRGLVLS